MPLLTKVTTNIMSDVSHYRGEFLKQQCPVSSCVLTSNRNKFQTADLVMFKVELKNLCFIKVN